MKRTVCLMTVCFLAFGMVSAIVSADEVTEKSETAAAQHTRTSIDTSPAVSYTTHEPIRINSDAEFTAKFANRTIWGLEINGVGKGFCIFIGNCSLPFTVKNCYLHHASGRFALYFWDTALILYKSSNGVIEHNNITSSRRGIYLEQSPTNTIRNNNCDSSRDNIYLYVSGTVTIANNTVTRSSMYNGIYVANSHSCIITGNMCTNNSEDGIYISYSDSVIIMNNNCSGNGGGVYTSHMDSGIISDNTCADNWQDGICVMSSRMNKISNNLCMFNKQYGIHLSYSATNTLQMNKLSGCGIFMSGDDATNFNTHSIDATNKVNGKNVFYAKNTTAFIADAGVGQVLIANCTNFAVTGQIISNASAGIFVAHSSNCQITNNILAKNSCYGLFLISVTGSTVSKVIMFANAIGLQLYESDSNDIANCTLANNMDCGAHVDTSNRNKFTDCAFNSNAGYGLYMTSSEMNRINNNTFVQNNVGIGTQAYDDMGINIWNGTAKGNWWDDWTGPDADGNGIVDVPYELDGGMDAKDYYPLTVPAVVPESPLPAPLLVLCILLIAVIATVRERKK